MMIYSEIGFQTEDFLGFIIHILVFWLPIDESFSLFSEISLGMLHIYNKWCIFMEHVYRESMFIPKQLIRL